MLVSLAACSAPVGLSDAGRDSSPDAGYVAPELDAAPEDGGGWYYCRAYYALVHARCADGEMAPLCLFGSVWPVDGARERIICWAELDCAALLAEVRRPRLCQ